jgi:hypothetical protein
VANPSSDYQERLTRLAFLLIRNRAEAEQVARDVLASGPPDGRDYHADHRAVARRCNKIRLGRIPGDIIPMK